VSVALVVVNHASDRLVARHLAATAQGLPEARVVVVDNSPDIEHRQRIAELAHTQGWDLVPMDNLGYGAGVNRGVERANSWGAQITVVLNPDLAASAELVQVMVAACQERDVIVTPRIDREDGRSWFTRGQLDLRQGRTRSRAEQGEVQWISGACFAVRTATWLRLGGYDPRYFMYWEDIDLGWRAVQAGVELTVLADQVAVHWVGGTQSTAGTRRKSQRYYTENCRNRLVFAAHHLDRADRWRWILTSPGYAWEVLLRGGRRQLLSDLRPLWAVTRGTLSGAWYAMRSRPGWPTRPAPEVLR